MNRKVLLINGKELSMTADEAFIQFQNLLKKAAYPWSSRYEFDDMFQVACLGFMEAYIKYDVSKGYQFSTYLYSTVSGELKRYNRKANKHLDVYSLNAASNEDENQEYLDVIADETDYEEKAVNNVLIGQVDNLLKGLELQHRRIIKDYYMNGLTQRDISAKYNLSLNYVCRLIKSLLKQAYDYVNGYDIKPIHSYKTITYEQLLSEINKYGTGKDAVLIIANKYEVKPSTVQNKIYYHRLNSLKNNDMKNVG